METVKDLHAYFCLLLACGVLSLNVSASVHPGAREDVMGQYRLTNRQQCHRLCWYRALCGSYSYHTESSAPLMDMSTPPPNCVLHAQNDSENWLCSACVLHTQHDRENCLCSACTKWQWELFVFCLCSAHTTRPWELSMFCLSGLSGFCWQNMVILWTPHPITSRPLYWPTPFLPSAPSTPHVLQFIFPTTFFSCYFFIDHILSSPPLTCDVPPGGARDDHTTRAGGWQETSASSSHINNGCKARPCSNTDVCVPTSSTSEPTSSTSVATSSQSASYVCLPLPSHCADPDPVSHGDVVVSGSSQDDVAHVTCDVGYVAAPRNVSIEIVCLVSQCVCVVSRCVCMVSRVCIETVCLVSQYVCIVSQCLVSRSVWWVRVSVSQCVSKWWVSVSA